MLTFTIGNNLLQRSIASFTQHRDFDKTGKKKYTLTLPEESEMKVRFESRFENGNLRKAVKLSETEYNLVLSYDYNTNGHTQWFYFKMMAKLQAGRCRKFNLI